MRVFASLLLFAGCSLSVDYTGTFFPCGENESCPDDFTCQRGVCIPDEPAPPTCTAVVATGNQHSCIVRDTDGTVWCWGRNNEGQLGNNTTTDSNVPVQVEGITGATTVRTGAQYTCALVDGGVSCWGANDAGQLGDGSQTGSRTPVAVSGLTGVTAIALGEQHTCAIGAGGAVSCWGDNSAGQLGDGTTTSRRVPGPVPGVTATAIAASDDSSCAVDNGSLKCWGFNGEGLFMTGTTSDSEPSPVTSPLASNVAGVAIGGAHLCIFTQAGEVQCAGANSSGQLGNGTTTASTMPVTAFIPAQVTSLSLGGSHSCAVDDAGGAWCWGSDGGKLALEENLGAISAPVRTTFIDVESIAAGGDHTCARSRSGAIACAGSNVVGQLGNGERTTQPAPQAVPGLSNIESISAGGAFTCAVDATGGAQCWGRGNDGELGDGALHTRAEPVPVLMTGIETLVAGNDHACAIATDGTVSCWGRGTSGQLGDGGTASRGSPLAVAGLTGATQIAVGANHTCALAGGVVRCWGSNSAGQLGVAANPSRTPVDVMGLVDTPITAIATGNNHTCAIDSLGEMQCWGGNGNGQLGNNVSDVNSSTPVKVLVAADTRLTGVEEIAARGDTTFARVGGQIFAWGNACSGPLGIPSPTFCDNPLARQVSDVATAGKLAIGFSSRCTLESDASITCWGDNYFGQLGDGTFSSSGPIPLPGLTGILDLGVGGEHACAVNGDGTVVCWGGAHNGALGDGVIEDRGPNFVRFSCD